MSVMGAQFGVHGSGSGGRFEQLGKRRKFHYLSIVIIVMRSCTTDGCLFIILSWRLRTNEQERGTSWLMAQKHEACQQQALIRYLLAHSLLALYSMFQIGTWKSGVSILHTGIRHPNSVMKNVIPIVMAGGTLTSYCS